MIEPNKDKANDKEKDQEKDRDLDLTPFAPTENPYLNQRDNAYARSYVPNENEYLNQRVEFDEDKTQGVGYLFPYWDEYSSED